MKIHRDALIAVVCCLAFVTSSAIGNCCSGKARCCALVGGESATVSATGSKSPCCAKKVRRQQTRIVLRVGGAEPSELPSHCETKICRCAPPLPVEVDGLPIFTTAPQELDDVRHEFPRSAAVGAANRQPREYECPTPPGRAPPRSVLSQS